MKKIISLISLIFFLNIFSVYSLNCGFERPASSFSSLGNNTLINVSYSNAGITEATIRVDVNISSPSTRNSSSLTSIFSISNTTGGSLSAPFSVNSSFPNGVIIEDSNDYTIACSCTNSTTSVNCNSTRTSMTVDRLLPAPPSSITFSNPLKAGDTITMTINRGLANSCFVLFGGTGVSRTPMTLSGSTCTYTVQANSPSNGDYQTYFSASDKLNETLSNLNYVTVSASGSGGDGILTGEIPLPSSQKGQSILGGQQTNPFVPQKKNDNWGMWAVVGFLVFLYFKGKK